MPVGPGWANTGLMHLSTEHMVAVGTRVSSRAHRVAGGGRPPPAPTERSMRICRTTLFDSWFTALGCYLFKFRFHGQLIFSLNRRPCLPLNGAHVAQEQFTCR